MRLFSMSGVSAFLKDRHGAYAIMYALASVPILLGIGIAIDYRTAQLARAQLQDALDSALLATTRTYSETAGSPEADRIARSEAAGRNVFEQNLLGASVQAEPVDIRFSFTESNVQVQANVRGTSNLVFGGLFGQDQLNLGAQATARGADIRRVEVVLALDNSGSMTSTSPGTSKSRMRLLRAASHNFVDYLFDTGDENNIFVGIVPWTHSVNVAFETPANTFSNASWSQNNNLGDGGTGTGTWSQASTSFMNTYVVMPRLFRTFTLRGGQALTASPLVRPNVPVGIDTNPRDNIDDNLGIALSGDDSYSSKTNTTLLSEALLGRTWLGCIRAADNERRNNTSGVVTQALTDDVPSGGLRWQPYVLESGVSGATSTERQPNCSSPMLPLSASRTQVKQNLERMRAAGNTYQDIGLTWALRMLSPRNEWATFFRYGANNRPAAYDVNETRKIIVLLTDGENVASTNAEQYYGCDQNANEASDNRQTFNRQGVASWVRRSGAGGCWRAAGLNSITDASLDNLLLDACNQIRNVYNIELYTIAVDVTNTNAISLLNRCVGGTDTYRSPRFENISGAEINSVLLAIAQESLRLTE